MKRARLSSQNTACSPGWRSAGACLTCAAPCSAPSPCRNIGVGNGNLNGNDNLGSANGNRE
jgi:hypothetical protein